MHTRDGDIEEYTIIENVFAELDQHNLSKLSLEEKIVRQRAIANNLVLKTNDLSHPTALTILMRATRHPLFKEKSANKIIKQAYKDERYKRSPINTGEKTLVFLQAYEITNPKDVDDFLLNPERVFGWINQAPATEIANVIDYYFSANSPFKYYKNIYAIAENEYQNNILGKGFILLCILLNNPLKAETSAYCQHALNHLHNEEPDKFTRVINMAAARVNPCVITIQHASNHYINGNKIKLPNSDFSNLLLQAAKFNFADLSNSNFSLANMGLAQLENANLFQSNFDSASLESANLTGANLSYANLFRVNLKGANLTRTNLHEVTFFSDKTFNSVDAFKMECHYLSEMIYQHNFRAKLITAIMNDLLKRIYYRTISEEVLIPIIEAAYSHPLFSQHDDHHTFKTTTNAVTSNVLSASTAITSTVFGWFSKPSAPQTTPTQESTPLYETRAQTRLREELQNLKNAPVKKTRPKPPNIPPSAIRK